MEETIFQVIDGDDEAQRNEDTSKVAHRKDSPGPVLLQHTSLCIHTMLGHMKGARVYTESNTIHPPPTPEVVQTDSTLSQG